MSNVALAIKGQAEGSHSDGYVPALTYQQQYFCDVPGPVFVPPYTWSLVDKEILNPYYLLQVHVDL